MSELNQFRKDPNNFNEYSDEDFEPISNEIVSINLVRSEEDHRIYVKKDFDFIFNEEEDESEEVNLSNDADSDNESSFSGDCKNPLKYFKREVQHLYDVQFVGYPFLHFIGFNYRTTESCPFIITEYMKGKTLGYLIENRFDGYQRPNTLKMIIFYGVAFALKILHSMKIIHRDIKPENVFLNEEKEPFLGDFGFARYIHETPELTDKIGTTYYMPKELFDDENIARPSDKIDSYSFAVMVLQTIGYDLTIPDRKKKGSVLSLRSSDLDRATLSDYIKNGGKYIIPETVPKNYRDMIVTCFSDENERPSMQRIVKMMDDGELDLPDFDEVKFNEYKNKLKKAEEKHERRNFSSSDDHDVVDKKKKKKKPSLSKFKPKISYIKEK